MKLFKTSFLKALFILVAIVSSTIIHAQPQGRGQHGNQQGPPPIPNSKQIVKMVDELATHINLSAKQKEQVLIVYKLHFENVKDKTSGNSRPEREEMQALRTAFEKQVIALLTDSQTEKYTAFLKDNNRNKRPQ